jgi:hypothetical protein
MLSDNYVKAGQLVDPAIQAIIPNGMNLEQLMAPRALPMRQTQSYADVSKALEPDVRQAMSMIQKAENDMFQQEKMLPIIMRYDPEKGMQLQATIEAKKEAIAASKERMAEQRYEFETRRQDRALEVADKRDDRRWEILQRGRGGRGGSSSSGDNTSLYSNNITLTTPAKGSQYAGSGVREIRDKKSKVILGYETSDGTRMSAADYNKKMNPVYETRRDGHKDENYQEYIKELEAQAETDPKGAYIRAREYGLTDEQILGYKGFKSKIGKYANGTYKPSKAPTSGKVNGVAYKVE